MVKTDLSELLCIPYVSAQHHSHWVKPFGEGGREACGLLPSGYPHETRWMCLDLSMGGKGQLCQVATYARIVQISTVENFHVDCHLLGRRDCLSQETVGTAQVYVPSISGERSTS